MRTVVSVSVLWSVLLALLLPGTALAELRNASIPLTPVTSAAGSDLCHLSVGYATGRDITTYGPSMGCQWGKRSAFLLDWSIAPGHSDLEEEEVKFGVAAHLAMGLKVSVLQIPLGDSASIGWSLQGKAIGGTSVFESHGWGYEYGGTLGTALSVVHPLPRDYSLGWGAYLDWWALAGDLNGDVASGDFDKGLVDLGLSLAVSRKGKPTSLFGTWGALMHASESSTAVSWVSLGVRF